MLQSALFYAEKFSFSVIPCRPDKKPFIKWELYQKQKVNPEEIREWPQKYGNFMIGVVTGEISNLLVIDCDTREGFESVQELLPDSLIIPTARTPRGGWHLYFIYPKDCGLTVGTGVMPGVDFRGRGGYIIAPPSINSTGNGYVWENGLSLNDIAPPFPPDAIINILINNSLYKGGEVTPENQRLQMTSLTSSDFKMFVSGRRDEDLFHIANCLIKGHAKPKETYQVLNILARNSNPPFPENEIKAKINSAIQRAEKREINFASEVRDFVVTSSGFFLTSDVFNRLQMTSRQEKKNVVLALLRLQKEGIIERHGQRDGCYRRIENEIEETEWIDVAIKEIPVKYPFQVHEQVITLPKNICILAGTSNSGKTAFMLDFVNKNMDKFKDKINYFSSEMGGMELKNRIINFGYGLEYWKDKFKFYERAGNFSDVIKPDEINIIDYLDITDEFYKVGTMIKEIFDKLNQGIAIIALQKNPEKEYGRGGAMSIEKARLYLTIDPGRIKIVKAKNWRTEINPNGLYKEFKLVKGCNFREIGNGWKKETKDLDNNYKMGYEREPGEDG